jgi:hypothetical protein
VTPPDDPPLGDDEPEDPSAAEETTVDAADKANLREQKRRHKRAGDEAADLWHAVFATPIGRREMWKLLHEDMHAFETRFGAGPNGAPDPYATWYHRGQQDLGVRLYQRWMALEPTAIVLMHQENDPRFVKPKRRRKESQE